MTELQAKIKLLPTSPGVYVMLDSNSNVIYVGKAKNLKNRVTQYFRNGFKTEKVAAMVMNIADFYYVITPNEADALSLENNLIKKHKPKYNILLKDDKTYPYIRVNLKENYPSFTIIRRIKKDGAKYFGPYMLGVNVNDVLSIVKEAYLIRPCTSPIKDGKIKKECLNYHIGLCLSPCSGKCDKNEYLIQVKKAMDFLSGNDDEAEKLLTEKMLKCAENEEFERATSYRDKLKILSRLKEKKITSISRFITADVISQYSDGIFSSIAVMMIRGGRTTGMAFYGEETLSDGGSEILTEFINRYYSTSSREIPDEIILSDALDESLAIEELLTSLAGKKVSVLTPKQGVKKSLADMCKANAEDYLSRQINKIKHKDDMTKVACQKLKETLNLKNYPRRMECFDISHISGVDKVGAMTVFIDGEPCKTEYRKFKVKIEGNDDYASMHEVLTRRLQKLNTDEEYKFPMPDLVIIDGGKGQLSAVKDLFSKYAPSVDLISLAEREEEIFTIHSKDPIVLSKTDYCLKMLQRIRDEAHRFAITFNKDLRTKRTLKSLLTEIDGIGKKKRDALMDKFLDIPTIKRATIEELLQVDGIGKAQAEKIKEFLSKD